MAKVTFCSPLGLMKPTQSSTILNSQLDYMVAFLDMLMFERHERQISHAEKKKKGKKNIGQVNHINGAL